MELPEDGWETVAASFALLHWDEIEVLEDGAAAPAARGPREPGAARDSDGSKSGNGNRTLKIKCLRTRDPGLSLLVTDLINVYYFSATGAELQDQKAEFLPMMVRIATKDLVGILCDMLQPHQPETRITAIRSEEGLELRVVKSVTAGHLDLSWTFRCVSCGTPTDQATIIRDQILLPLQDMVNQLYFRSHLQARQYLQEQQRGSTASASSALPANSVLRQQQGGGQQQNVLHIGLDNMRRNDGANNFNNNNFSSSSNNNNFSISSSQQQQQLLSGPDSDPQLGGSLEEQFQLESTDPGRSLVSLMELPDSQLRFGDFASSERLRRSLGAHYRSVMSLRSHLIKNSLGSLRYGRLQEELQHHRLAESQFLDMEALLSPAPKKKTAPQLHSRQGVREDEEEDEEEPGRRRKLSGNRRRRVLDDDDEDYNGDDGGYGNEDFNLDLEDDHDDPGRPAKRARLQDNKSNKNKNNMNEEDEGKEVKEELMQDEDFRESEAEIARRQELEARLQREAKKKAAAKKKKKAFV